MSDTWSVYEARRLERRALARRVADDPARAAEILSGWQFARRPRLLEPLLRGLEVPDGPDVRRLGAWAFAELRPRSIAADASEEAIDRELLEHDAALELDAVDRRAAALYLLGRLGDEVQRRERRAWEAAPWAPGEKDRETRAVWDGLLRPAPDYQASMRFRKLFGQPVRTAFAGVAVVLRLPPETAAYYAKQALDQLDLIGLGSHLDLAARIVETAGEPVRSLARALGPAALSKVERCLARRDGWSQARKLLEENGGIDGPADGLAEGAELAIFLRLIASATEGRLPTHPLGLPGWGIISANRARIRGRLRAASSEDLEALRAGVMGLPGLYERTTAAVSRHAWEWAWREARTGFGFDPERLKAAPCTLDPGGAQVLTVIGAADEPAVLTFLLLALGRGVWGDIERWLQGAPAQTMSKSFYRCLKQVPDQLADPMAPGQRVRRYQRLWDHLSEGGVDAYVPRMTAVAARVAALEAGRNLKLALHEALQPAWDTRLVPLPEHHLPTFLESFGTFLKGGREAAAAGEPRPEDERHEPGNSASLPIQSNATRPETAGSDAMGPNETRPDAVHTDAARKDSARKDPARPNTARPARTAPTDTARPDTAPEEDDDEMD